MANIRRPPIIRFELPFADADLIPLTSFVDNFMPPLPSGLNLDAFIRRLKAKRRSGKQLITKEDRLWGYGAKLPSQFQPNRAFRHLKTCADRLATALPRRTPIHRFIQTSPSSSQPCIVDSFPDVYFGSCEKEASQSLRWSDIAVCGIFALEASESTKTEVSGENLCSSGHTEDKHRFPHG